MKYLLYGEKWWNRRLWWTCSVLVYYLIPYSFSRTNPLRRLNFELFCSRHTAISSLKHGQIFPEKVHIFTFSSWGLLSIATVSQFGWWIVWFLTLILFKIICWMEEWLQHQERHKIHIDIMSCLVSKILKLYIFLSVH